MDIASIVRGEALDFFLPPDDRGRATPDALRAKILGLFSMVVAAAGLWFAVLFQFVFDAPVSALACLAGAAGLATTYPIVRLSGWVDLAAHWASLSLCVALAVIVSTTGGILSPGVTWFALVPAFALVVARDSGGEVWLFVSIAMIFVFHLTGFGSSRVGQFDNEEWRLMAFAGSSVLLVIIYGLFRTYDVFAAMLERRSSEFEQQAKIDELTALPNRRSLEEHLDEEFATARTGGYSMSAGLMDIDDFKSVNDNYGHEVGDQLIGQVADRLSAVFRDSDFLARFGGDEFVVVLHRVTEAEEFEAVVDRLRRSFDEPFEFDGDSLAISLSIGFAVVQPERLPEAETKDVGALVVDAADQAMYAAKEDEGISWRIQSTVYLDDDAPE